MSDEPWRTENWFSSPWNYLPEITEGFTLPQSVEVHDVTLTLDNKQTITIKAGETVGTVIVDAPGDDVFIDKSTQTVQITGTELPIDEVERVAR